ncbi:MAG: hypothetical protein HYX72_09280 [Acidobacteria bacterium]|nr:hypothetical protein [Acidobacteriota bacterium]
MSHISALISVVCQFGLAAGLLIIIACLLRIIFDEDRSALWRAHLYKIIYAVTQKREAEKKFISNDINARINLARRKLHFGKEILPRSVNVEWVANSASDTYDLKEGDFVVRLDPATRQEANIVRLATAVVERTSCLGTRHLMESPLITAVDLNLVRNILREVGDRKILDWFFENEYKLRLENDPALSKWNGQIVEIDDKGLFTRIFLIELDSFARKIHGMAPKLYMAGEIEGLISFLYRIATKELNQDVPLNYRKAYIRIGVILVARTSTLLTRGIEPYVKAMNCNLEKQVDSVYLIVFDKELLGSYDPRAGDEFIRLTGSLDEAFKGSTVTKDFEVIFYCVDSMGRRRTAKCIRYLTTGTV